MIGPGFIERRGHQITRRILVIGIGFLLGAFDGAAQVSPSLGRW